MSNTSGASAHGFALNRLTIYTKRMDAMVAFYCDHFGYTAHRRPNDRIVELRPANGGVIFQFHAAAKSQKEGQALVKLSFDVRDVPQAREALIAAGVKVGPIHDGGGYAFANLKDPSKNSVQITSRAFADLSVWP